MAQLTLPQGAWQIIQRLDQAGFEAWAVGGCVRDSLLGRKPKDWDICTSAQPEQMQRLFQDWHTIQTGLRFGTLTVVIDHQPFEVTTFRVDGAYSDHRHPDGVTLVSELREDLARRDFTVNAMAYHPERGLVDLFGGREDLRAGVIRCVGLPEQRFGEDALRMLRALRFAARYGFRLDEATAAAIHAMHRELKDIAVERVRTELSGLLCGQAAGQLLRAFSDVICFLLPELAPCVGFDQRTPHHRYDVWEHSVRAVEAIEPTEALRLTMLLHDCGKPGCFRLDGEGVGHSCGHAALSQQLAEQAMGRLRVDNATRERVSLLIAWHDAPLDAGRKTLLRLLNRVGEEALRQLIQVQRADRLAKGTVPADEVEAWAGSVRAALDALLAEQPCFTLKQLQLNGRDLMALGLRGPAVGAELNALLQEVLDGSLPNERAALLRRAAELDSGAIPTDKEEPT